MTPEEAMDIARGTPPSFVNDDGRRAAVILADEVERLQEENMSLQSACGEKRYQDEAKLLRYEVERLQKKQETANAATRGLSSANMDMRRQRDEAIKEVERLREALTTCKELAEITSNGHHRVALACVHRVTEKALEPKP